MWGTAAQSVTPLFLAHSRRNSTQAYSFGRSLNPVPVLTIERTITRVSGFKGSQKVCHGFFPVIGRFRHIFSAPLACERLCSTPPSYRAFLLAALSCALPSCKYISMTQLLHAQTRSAGSSFPQFSGKNTNGAA